MGFSKTKKIKNKDWVSWLDSSLSFYYRLPVVEKCLKNAWVSHTHVFSLLFLYSHFSHSSHEVFKHSVKHLKSENCYVISEYTSVHNIFRVTAKWRAKKLTMILVAILRLMANQLISLKIAAYLFKNVECFLHEIAVLVITGNCNTLGNIILYQLQLETLS